jgi:hypothetical protein
MNIELHVGKLVVETAVEADLLHSGPCQVSHRTSIFVVARGGRANFAKLHSTRKETTS